MYKNEEFADEDWVEDEDDGDDLLQCPSCHLAVHEETQQCPHCGDWITPVYPNEGSRRILWVIMVVVLIVALLALTL